jgi:hypothetical protein
MMKTMVFILFMLSVFIRAEKRKNSAIWKLPWTPSFPDGRSGDQDAAVGPTSKILVEFLP